MATRSRFAGAAPKELFTADEINHAIQKNKLVVILFNERYAKGETVETHLNYCQAIYEYRDDVHFYKSLFMSSAIDSVEKKHKVQSCPTFLFFRDGELVCRFDDADDEPEDIATQKKNLKTEITALKDITDPKEYQLRVFLEKLCGRA
ncbi:unnamed protein product [Adineta ricciae]|uniref:Thioredoxin domain-containing protein n=1 Tax=Adineta ricciae TaxID=249248 RepID=A0A814AQE8_ADIRI|nr:unnamed protein product [Adineta ricciae]CAF1486580.1 unnamed protein product [Adineta ricciae]